MTKAIDWTHLFEKYRGRWVALAQDETTVVASGATAKEVHDATKDRAGLHFLYRVPDSLDTVFVGYAI